VCEVSVNPKRIGILMEKQWTLSTDRIKTHNIKFVDKDFNENT